MKRTIIALAALVLCTGAFASDNEQSKPRHFKPYGFIRTYFAFDTRESNAGTEDLYYYMPNPEKLNAAGVDVNDFASFRFAAITSRLGLDVVGYEFGGYKIGAKVECDFYALTTNTSSKVTGAALMRLRQAYATVAKDNRSWKIGQAWHPMAADMPDMLSLDTGVPFAPFSRTPQVTFDWNFAGPWSLTASAIGQMQYMSTGPDGAVADYLRNGIAPELYLGLNLKENGNIIRFGADFISLKPRRLTAAGKKASDRMTNWNLFFYGQTKLGFWDWKTKVVYANDCSHVNMIGGYGVSGVLNDGSYTYSADRNLSAWTTFSRKKKDCPWVPQLFLGFTKMFGTAEEIITIPDVKTFYEKLNASIVNCAWCVQPEILYNLGKMQFGAQLMYTGVNYGRSTDSYKRAQDCYTVNNYRIQLMVKYTF